MSHETITCHRLQEWKPALRVLFIDDGGVLNDNSLRGPEWRRLIGDYMPQRLGGTAHQWSEANLLVFPQLWSRLQAKIADFPTYSDFQHAYDIGWIGGMCKYIGIPTPPDAEAVLLAREVATYAGLHARAAIHGAAEAVHLLRRSGYRLHTASGTPSWELEGIVTRMGIRHEFTTLYGPDLVDHVKSGPEYYGRIFSHAAVDPDEVLVVESCPQCCGWAAEAGARTVLVDPNGGQPGTAGTLAEVATALA
jgi:beta-phosphoglucomutase-like phosphatase (HAD superfamily)